MVRPCIQCTACSAVADGATRKVLGHQSDLRYAVIAYFSLIHDVIG